MVIITKHIPVTIRGSPYGNGESPYGNGDSRIPCESPFPYGDPHFHMGIIMKRIPVTIWGSPYGNGESPYGNGARQIPCASPFPVGDPRFHMGIRSHSSPLPYGDPRMVMGTRYHTGTVQSLTHYHMGIISIWGLWKKSPYGNNYHMGIPVTIWGSPYGFG